MGVVTTLATGGALSSLLVECHPYHHRTPPHPHPPEVHMNDKERHEGERIRPGWVAILAVLLVVAVGILTVIAALPR